MANADFYKPDSNSEEHTIYFGKARKVRRIHPTEDE